LITSSGQLFELEKGGLLLGVKPHINYESGSFAFDEFESLLLFTDGVTETMNAADEEYGEGRLKDNIHAMKKASAAKWGESLLDEVRQFKNSSVPQDDITVVVVKKGDSP
jgi:sigma-B regulation protein RsbU (phosphoserine phosphatase)